MQRSNPTLRRKVHYDYDIVPGSTVAKEIGIPSALDQQYKSIDCLHAGVIEAIRKHLYADQRQTEIKRGSYNGGNYHFELDRDLKVVRDLSYLIQVKVQNLDFIEPLLQPEFVNRFIAAGHHVIAVKANDGSDNISHYQYFYCCNDLVIRKDKYGNIVCDVLENKKIGEGTFGQVNYVEGTLKYRFMRQPGIKFEPGNHQRIIKVCHNKFYDRNTFTGYINLEHDTSEQSGHLGVRDTFFGTKKYDSVAGFSSKYIPEKELHGIINDDLTSDILNISDRFQLTISILRALKSQVIDHGLLHRDIKPDNIRIQKIYKRWIASMIDFGLSRFENAPDARFGGTAAYIPLECVDKKQTGYPYDIFSAALVLALLWRDYHQVKITTLSKDGILDIRDDYNWYIPLDELFWNIDDSALPERIKKLIADVLSKMLDKDPDRRPTIETCIAAFSKIYEAYIDLSLNPVSLPQVKYARDAADKIVSICQTHSDKIANRDNAKALVEQMTAVINTMADTPATMFALTQRMNVEYAYACNRKFELTEIIQTIVTNFMAGVDDINSDYNVLVALRDKVVAAKNPESKELLGLCKTINQLRVFCDRMNKMTLDLEMMDKEVKHFQNKHAKMLESIELFKEVFTASEQAAENAPSPSSSVI